MKEMSYSSPLKIMRPFYLDEIGTAYVYVMDVSGGMLAGDKLDYSVRVSQNAHLFLTSTAATKIHPMENEKAKITTKLMVEENGSLEYFPEEVILFENSLLDNDTVIELHPSSVLACSEIIFMGRKHYGEVNKFTRLKSNFEIKINGEIMIWDRFDISPVENELDGLGYMEKNSHYGSFFLYSKENNTELLETIRTTIQVNQQQIQIGCSLHTSGMIIVKALANNHYSIKQQFKEIWKRIRPIVLKEEYPNIRK